MRRKCLPTATGRQVAWAWLTTKAMPEEHPLKRPYNFVVYKAVCFGGSITVVPVEKPLFKCCYSELVNKTANYKDDKHNANSIYNIETCTQ